VVLSLLAVLLPVTGAGLLHQGSNNSTDHETASVNVGDVMGVRVEVADSEQERESGLSGRSEVAAGTGMLFIWDTATPVDFWMKDTRVPLDIVWLSGDTVVGVDTMTPCLLPGKSHCPRWTSPGPITGALEAPRGTFTTISTGDRITIEDRVSD
jgi:uncharacterized membrane protein (UPF0127 family)